MPAPCRPSEAHIRYKPGVGFQVGYASALLGGDVAQVVPFVPLMTSTSGARAEAWLSGFQFAGKRGPELSEAQIIEQLLYWMKEGTKARQGPCPTPYAPGSLANTMHSAGWVQESLRLALAASDPNYRWSQKDLQDMRAGQYGTNAGAFKPYLPDEE